MHEYAPGHSSLRILVVDDNYDAAATMSMLLELAGHQTGTAHNGRDAVTAATRERYDVVLLDLHMPIMDGFKTADVLGQLRPAPKLIACSACGDAEARRRTSELGFCAHLTKPVPLDLLQDTLGRHCRAAPVSSHMPDAIVQASRPALRHRSRAPFREGSMRRPAP